MRIVKIGMNQLPKLDVNSAKYEYELISGLLNNIHAENTIVILGGKFTEADNYVIPLLSNYSRKIFVATDTVAIASCKEIIELCDVLLHQCPKRDIEGITIRQRYSYIPELFYKVTQTEQQDDLLFFAGAFRDIKPLVLDYIDNNKSKVLLKTENNDRRLVYYDYLNELKTHKYGLVLLRKQNHIPGWITSRFVEYVACNVFPIVHFEYDEDDYFSAIKTYNGIGAKALIDLLKDNETFRVNYINALKSRFEKDNLKFIDVIMEELI